MKRLLLPIALLTLCAVASARARNERSEIEVIYKSMSKAFSAKDAKGYSSCWTPAIRWFPPRKQALTTVTRDRASLMHDLRVEFSKRDKVAQDFAFIRFETEPERATVELAVSITHKGVSESSRSFSERHHWFKAGGKWWLSRIEALG